MATDVSTPGGSLAVRRLLDGFVDRLVGECPGLSPALVRSSCLTLTDAVIVWELLDAADRPVEVVDVGASFGVSTYLLASHRAVRRVIAVDRSPRLFDGTDVDRQRARSAVRSVLVGAPGVADKLVGPNREGAEGSPDPGHGPDAPRLDLTGLSGAGEALLVGLIDARTSEEVLADLEALLEARPDALALVHGCRHESGPFVQAGVARLLASHPDHFRFTLLADLSPGLGASNLGVVHTAAGDGGLPAPVARLVESLSRRLDPLRQLEREQELVAQVLSCRDELTEARYVAASMRTSLSWRLTAPLRKLNRRSRHDAIGGAGSAE